MKTAVDGTIYTYQLYGGITRILNEILPRMCDLDRALSIDLWTWSRLKQTYPSHGQITRRVVADITLPKFRPYRVWRRAAEWVNLRNHLTRSRIIGQSQADIWHATYYWQPPEWGGRQITSVYDMKEENFPDIASTPKLKEFQYQKSLSINRADIVICISESTRQDVLRHYNISRDRVVAVPLACQDLFTQREREKISVPVEGDFVLFVGGRSVFKNFSVLLSVFARWQGRYDCQLVVAGSRWTPAERQMLHDLDISDRIVLLPNVSDEELCHLYNKAAAFIYPSLYEGFGIPLLEAMACGCPVVASRIPSTIEVTGEHAILFDPTDEEELLAAIDQAIAEGRQSKRVEDALQWVKQYSWEKVAEQTLAIYKLLA